MIQVLDELFPIVSVDCGSRIDAASVASFEAGMERLFARKERFVIVCDLTSVSTIPDAIVRKKLADLLNRADFKAKQARYQLGSANLISSSGVRAALTALLWLWQPSAPMHFPSTKAEADEWALGRLREGGVVVPPLVAERVRAGRRAAGSR